MNNLTKEQINLFTVIGSVILLVCFFFLPGATVSMFGFSASASMSKMLFGGGAGFIAVIAMILGMLCPIYLILHAYKDNPALAALKPIFVLDRKVAGIILVVAALLMLIGVAVEEMVSIGFGVWLYLIIAACICYLGFIYKEN